MTARTAGGKKNKNTGEGIVATWFALTWIRTLIHPYCYHWITMCSLIHKCREGVRTKRAVSKRASLLTLQMFSTTALNTTSLPNPEVATFWMHYLYRKLVYWLHILTCKRFVHDVLRCTACRVFDIFFSLFVVFLCVFNILKNRSCN